MLIVALRSDEVEEETHARMLAVQSQGEEHWDELTDLLEAEFEYFAKCKDILEELREVWPTGYVDALE